MIEPAQYRIVFKRPDISKEEANDVDAFNAKWRERRAEVSDYITQQASAYDAAADDDERGKSHLVIAKSNEAISAILDVTSTKQFKNFLKDQQHELIPIIESSSGMQFVVMASFVPSPHQSNIEGLNRPLLAMEFWRVSNGVNAGKAITQVEADARVEMNDRLFDKIAKALERVKQNNPDYQIEAQEKSLGSFFVRVTSKDNKEGGVSRYEVTNALGRLTSDPDVSAALVGPDLYPSDVEALRQKNASIPPLPRQPKKLDM